MKVLITGAKGQLGTSLQEVLTEDQLFPVDLPELNLISFTETMDYVLRVQPDLIIHCAAKTQVDECELKPDEAYQGNVIATKNVVNACQAVNAELVYISTDYVFDGQGTRPYWEYDPCNPKSIYGLTKWQGEEIVKMHLRHFYIVRTAWLFGDVGHNFVRTILKLAREKDELRIVDDQVGSPTYSMDLAEIIKKLIPKKAYGIYHITNEGSCSWFEFTKDILRYSGENSVRVEPISSGELNRPAPRPNYSILSKAAIKSLGISIPDYKEALQRFFIKNQLSLNKV